MQFAIHFSRTRKVINSSITAQMSLEITIINHNINLYIIFLFLQGDSLARGPKQIWEKYPEFGETHSSVL